jgi:hypothetical protein
MRFLKEVGHYCRWDGLIRPPNHSDKSFVSCPWAKGATSLRPSLVGHTRYIFGAKRKRRMTVRKANSVRILWNLRLIGGSGSESPYSRAFRTRPFRQTRTRTQTEVRNSDSDSVSDSDLRNRDFPTPWPKIISQWNTYDVLTIEDICACGL